MEGRRTEQIGETVRSKTSAVCGYCMQSTTQYRVAILKDRKDKLTEHRVCTNCGAKIERMMEQKRRYAAAQRDPNKQTEAW
jgi:hypothetical protein